MRAVSLEQSLEIMGQESFIGPEDIQNTFGFTPKDVPEIPFSGDDLERAKELGQHLILYVNVSENDREPFTLEDMISVVGNRASDGTPILCTPRHVHLPADTTPRPGWRLTSPVLTKGTTNKDCLEQTEVLISYLREEVFKDQDLPELYKTAIEKFEIAKEERLQSFSESMDDWEKLAQGFRTLPISWLLRENAPEVVYRLILTERKNGVKHLSGTHTLTSDIESSGRIMGGSHLIIVGGIARQEGWGIAFMIPAACYHEVGVCFSRSM